MHTRSTASMKEQEQCPDCLQFYAYELGVRCFLCDGRLCPFCITHLQTQAYCVACKEMFDVSTGDVES